VGPQQWSELVPLAQAEQQVAELVAEPSWLAQLAPVPVE
jgi:hypothetical protein